MASVQLRVPIVVCTLAFGALGDAIVTGPTLTNINDFRAVLIQQPGA